MRSRSRAASVTLNTDSIQAPFPHIAELLHSGRASPERGLLTTQTYVVWNLHGPGSLLATLL